MNERTAEILRRFEHSWDQVEARYSGLLGKEGWDFLPELVAFIALLRAQGFDKKFRLGTSMHRLVFSRSVNHGLRQDQKQVMIEPYKNGSYDISFFDFSAPGGLIRRYSEFSSDTLTGNKRVMGCLNKLDSTLID